MPLDVKTYVQISPAVERVKDSAVGIPLKNCPLYKAIHRLQSRDYVAGFTKRAIFKGYRRLNNSFTKSTEFPKKAFERFPESQVRCELRGNFANHGKARTGVYAGRFYKWAKDRGKVKMSVVSEEQVVEFAKNLLLSWTAEDKATFSVDEMVKELITLGLPVDNHIITSLANSFKAKDSAEINARDFLASVAGSKVCAHISDALKRAVQRREERDSCGEKSLGVAKWWREEKSAKDVSRTVKEIEVVQEWWEEVEQKAGCTDDVPIAVVTNFLIAKNLVKNSDQAKRLLGSTAKNAKKVVNFNDFKKFLYRGVLRNALRYLCAEINKSIKPKEAKFPEFVHIANYKRRLLMTALDPANPQHQQGVEVFDKLKKQYEKMGEHLVVGGEGSDSRSRQSRVRKRQNYSLSEKDYDDQLKSTTEIMQKYKKVVFAPPKFSELH